MISRSGAWVIFLSSRDFVAPHPSGYFDHNYPGFFPGCVVLTLALGPLNVIVVAQTRYMYITSRRNKTNSERSVLLLALFLSVVKDWIEVDLFLEFKRNSPFEISTPFIT